MSAKKPRCDSVIPSLPPEQRDALEAWLFEENIAYADAVKRCMQHWQIKVDRHSIQRFYQQTRQKRNLERIARCASQANALMKQFTDNPVDTYNFLLRMTGQAAFDLALDSPEKLDRRALLEFTKLFMSAHKEDRETARFSFERQKWEFDVTEACLNKLPELKVISNNSSLSIKDKIHRIRLELFGAAPE